MENNDLDGKSESPSASKESKMDRRDFFVKAAKLVIPTIGIMGLTLTLFPKKAAAVGSCQYRTCLSACEGFCDGSCSGTCQNKCEGSCFGGLKSWLPSGK